MTEIYIFLNIEMHVPSTLQQCVHAFSAALIRRIFKILSKNISSYNYSRTIFVHDKMKLPSGFNYRLICDFFQQQSRRQEENTDATTAVIRILLPFGFSYYVYADVTNIKYTITVFLLEDPKHTVD